eukprot:38813-Amphidinium_carterae.2
MAFDLPLWAGSSTIGNYKAQMVNNSIANRCPKFVDVTFNVPPQPYISCSSPSTWRALGCVGRIAGDLIFRTNCVTLGRHTCIGQLAHLLMMDRGDVVI